MTRAAWKRSIFIIVATLMAAPAFSSQWIAQPVVNVRRLYVVHALNSEVVWASGEMGQVALTVDGGANWLSLVVPGAIGLPALYAFDDQVSLVGDQLGHIYRTSDGGNTWNLVHTGPSSSFNGIHFFDALHGWAYSDPVEGMHTLVETSDGGLSWHPAPGGAPPAHAWNEIGIRRSFDWVGTQLGMFGTNKWKIWRTTDGGAQWDSVTTLMQWTPGLVMNDDGRGLLGGRTEGLETPMVGRSSDFGQTWSWVANPPQTSTFNTLDWIEGTEEVWASTLQTGLFQSTNGGLTWTRHDLGSSNVAEDLDFVDAGTGWCVGFGSSAGRIWRWYGATDVSLVPELPSFEIEARPNPFERDVFIGSQTPMIGPIEISIYDVLGRCLWSTEGVSPATGFRWDGHDYAGRSVSKGVYHYRFRAGSAEAFGRLIKVR